MMGVYFAASGLGNKVAGIVGEVSQSEPIKIELIASQELNEPFLLNKKDKIDKGEKFSINTIIYPENGQFTALDIETNEPVLSIIGFNEIERKQEILDMLNKNNVTRETPYHLTFQFEKIAGITEVNSLNYSGVFIIDEIQTQQEFRTFLGITIFTGLFGLLVILLLKPLKRLTHGAEDNEVEMLETEPFEISDPTIN